MKEEDHLGDVQLPREANQMKWQFLLLQNIESDEHAKFAMALLITKAACPLVEYDADLTQLLSYAINVGRNKFIYESCVH